MLSANGLPTNLASVRDEAFGTVLFPSHDRGPKARKEIQPGNSEGREDSGETVREFRANVDSKALQSSMIRDASTSAASNHVRNDTIEENVQQEQSKPEGVRVGTSDEDHNATEG